MVVDYKTPFWRFWLFEEGQVQAEQAFNEWLARFLALGFSVISQSTAAQPGSPAEFDAYRLPESATGAKWAGHDFQFAVFINGDWIFMDKAVGAEFWVADEEHLAVANDEDPDIGVAAIAGHQETFSGISVNLSQGLTANRTVGSGDGGITIAVTNPTKKEDGKTIWLFFDYTSTEAAVNLTWGSDYQFIGGSGPATLTPITSGGAAIFGFKISGGLAYEIAQVQDVR
jgi:hypothetical protein